MVTGILLVMSVVLLGSIFFISSLLSSPDKSPTQIQKTKAAQLTYKKEINLADTFGTDEITPVVTPLISLAPTLAAKGPMAVPTLLALAPTLAPTSIPTKIPTKTPTATPIILAQEPTDIPEPTNSAATPTLQPLLAYKSTSISPTLIPIKETGGMGSPSPTKKIQPTGVQNLPESGWIQISSTLFIVAMTTIFLSMLF